MKRLILFAVLMLFAQIGLAQDQQTVTMPDITGLNVPQAAAVLNENGLRIGSETAVDWVQGSEVQPNTIIEQSVTPGETVEFGATVDVTVARAANVLLVYDDNDLTLVNQTGGSLSVGSIVFRSTSGNATAQFNGGRWPIQLLENGDCAQVWSIGRREPKRIPECGETITWLTTNNPAEHFWTGSAGPEFTVVQDGIERGRCPVSATGRCGMYVSAGTASEVTRYVYFAYTPDRLVVYNQSDDKWMALEGILLNGSQLFPPSADIYSFLDPVANIQRLAPGQCNFARTSTNAEPPQDCTVIAEWFNEGGATAWRSEFQIQSTTDGQTRTCPAAVEGKLTLCILPR